MKIKSYINWKLFRLLLGAGIFGTLAAFPYLLTTQGEVLKELPIALPIVMLLSLAQTTILLSITIFIGLLLGKKVGLGTPLLSAWIEHQPIKEKLKSVGLLGVKLGTLAGVLIVGFDLILAQFMEPLAAARTPLWQGFLASFYGGIVEELLLRLFLVTLFVWLIWRFSKSYENKPASLSVWVAIVISAVIFGLGHLPATAAFTAITPLIIFRAIFLNGIGGVIFGWLYWKKGLEAAIIAHFSADVVLIIIFPLALSL